jgi:hypothetical protein
VCRPVQTGFRNSCEQQSKQATRLHASLIDYETLRLLGLPSRIIDVLHIWLMAARNAGKGEVLDASPAYSVAQSRPTQIELDPNKLSRQVSSTKLWDRRLRHCSWVGSQCTQSDSSHHLFRHGVFSLSLSLSRSFLSDMLRLLSSPLSRPSLMGVMCTQENLSDG